MADVLAKEDESPIQPVRRQRGRGVFVWLLAVGWLVWALARLVGLDRFTALSPVLIPAMAAIPYAAATVVLPVGLAALTRHWYALAVAALAAVLFAVIVLPRAIASGGPSVHGPELRVLTANLRFGGAGDASLVDLARRTRAEVLSLQEFTPEAEQRIDAAGIARLLPYKLVDPRPGAGGTGMYSRYPLVRRPTGPTTFGLITASVDVPGAGPLRFTAAHPPAPLGPDVTTWAHDLRQLPYPDFHGPLDIVAGDLNSSLDHLQLRRLIATGYRDAADVTGNGLAPTYRPWPPITIDHVLADRRIAALHTATYYQSGSDHRALFAVLRLP